MTCCTQPAPTPFFASLSGSGHGRGNPSLTLRALQPFSAGAHIYAHGQVFAAPEPEASALINAGLAQALDKP